MGQFPAPSGLPRCPVCGALVPVGESGRPALWCSLCLSSLHDATADTPQRDHTNGSTGAEVIDDAGAVASSAPNSADSPALDEQVVDQMLIELQAHDTDPWVALSKQWGSRRRQIALGAGVALALLVVILLAATIVGLFVR